MAADPLLDGMLRFLTRPGLEPADAVSFSSGGGSTLALYDDEELLQPDTLGQLVQVTDTVVRIREGALSARPVVGATVTTQKGTDAPLSWLVGEVRKDPLNPGMLRVQLRRT